MATLRDLLHTTSSTDGADFRHLVKHFVHDMDAQTIASLIHLNENTVNRYLTQTGKHIA